MAGLSIRSGMTWSPLLGPIRPPVSLSSRSPRHQRGVARPAAAGGGEGSRSLSPALFVYIPVWKVHLCLHLFLRLHSDPFWVTVVCESIPGFLVSAWCFISIFGIKQSLMCCCFFAALQRSHLKQKVQYDDGFFFRFSAGNLFYLSLFPSYGGCCCAC